MVEGYQMTATGLRKLGSGTVGSTGSKGPGMGVGAAAWLVTGSPVGLIVGGGLKVYGEASGNSKIEGRAGPPPRKSAISSRPGFRNRAGSANKWKMPMPEKNQPQGAAPAK